MNLRLRPPLLPGGSRSKSWTFGLRAKEFASLKPWKVFSAFLKFPPSWSSPAPPLSPPSQINNPIPPPPPTYRDAVGTVTAHLERLASAQRRPHLRRPRRGGGGRAVSRRPAESAWRVGEEGVSGRYAPSGPPPTPAARAPPLSRARCLTGLRLRCEWSGRGSWLLLLPRRRPLLFELWEAGGSQAAGVRSSRQRPHPGALRNPTVCPLPPFPPALPLIHSPTHPEPGRQPGSRGPAASLPRSWTSSCRRSRLPRVPRSRRLLTRSAPGLGAFSSPSSRGSRAQAASGPS